MFKKISRQVKIIVFSFLFVLVPFCASGDPTEGIEYNTENFPPFNFEGSDGKATGMNTEIITEMFKELNSSKGISDINVIPWARGYHLVKDTKTQTALFSTTRTPEREKLFQWVGPISATTNGLIVLKGNPLNVRKPGQPPTFSPEHIYGVINNDLGQHLLQQSNVPDSNILKVAKFEQLVDMLKSKRIEAISYNPDVAMWLIKSQGLSTKKFEVIYRQAVGEHYIAFNKSVSKEVVEQHQTAIDKILNNHALIEQIRSKYR